MKELKFDDIERQIVECLSRLPREESSNGGRDRDWTSGVMRALGDLGHSFKYDVCTSGWRSGDGTRCHPEWLYDMTWAGMKEGFLVSLPLALESEWSTKAADVDEDFSKLLIARAEHRVMIFQVRTCKDFEDTVRRLTSDIDAFSLTRPGDRYFFAGFIYEETRDFKFELVANRNLGGSTLNAVAQP